MASHSLTNFAEAMSWLCGWTYFLAWSISFYPQPILNWRRKTTAGCLPDFPLLNVLGFTSYLLATLVFMFSPVVRAQYAARHHASPTPTVRFNDVLFGANAWVWVVVTYSMYWPRLWGFQREGKGREGAVVVLRAQSFTKGLAWGCALGFVVVFGIVAFADGHGGSTEAEAWGWIDLMYATEYIKLILTLFKYLPQAVANYRRKSTIGWSIHQCLLDLTGSVMSLAQLVIDSSLQADWSGLMGNPVKLGLGYISLVFDIIFVVQHYVLYGPAPEDGSEVRQSLLGAEREVGR